MKLLRLLLAKAGSSWPWSVLLALARVFLLALSGRLDIIMMFHVSAVNMICHKIFKVKYGQEKGMGWQARRGGPSGQS
jgi:hypothetical protein